MSRKELERRVVEAFYTSLNTAYLTPTQKRDVILGIYSGLLSMTDYPDHDYIREQYEKAKKILNEEVVS